MLVRSSFVAIDSCVYFLMKVRIIERRACAVLTSLFRLNGALADLILAKVQLKCVFYMDNSKAEEYAL